jgi:hypothetical protein
MLVARRFVFPDVNRLISACPAVALAKAGHLTADLFHSVADPRFLNVRKIRVDSDNKR